MHHSDIIMFKKPAPRGRNKSVEQILTAIPKLKISNVCFAILLTKWQIFLKKWREIIEFCEKSCNFEHFI